MDILLTFELYNKRQLTHVSPGEEGKGAKNTQWCLYYLHSYISNIEESREM